MTTIYRGFFNGDSTGIGKGRQMAGIILDSIAVRPAIYCTLSVFTPVQKPNGILRHVVGEFCGVVYV